MVAAGARPVHNPRTYLVVDRSRLDRIEHVAMRFQLYQIFSWMRQVATRSIQCDHAAFVAFLEFVPAMKNTHTTIHVFVQLRFCRFSPLSSQRFGVRVGHEIAVSAGLVSALMLLHAIRRSEVAGAASSTTRPLSYHLREIEFLRRKFQSNLLLDGL